MNFTNLKFYSNFKNTNIFIKNITKLQFMVYNIKYYKSFLRYYDKQDFNSENPLG